MFGVAYDTIIIIIIIIIIIVIIIIIIIIIKKSRQYKAEREWCTPYQSSPKTPAPQYQPFDRKKGKGKNSRRL